MRVAVFELEDWERAPHSAFNTREAVERILDTTIENIRAFASGAPVNVVS